MCKEIFGIANSLLSGTVVAIVTIKYQNWYQKKQNMYQDARANLPILLDILKGLKTLEEVYIFRGLFCPSLEHRCPSLSNEDGDGDHMSYAQRGHKFKMIGYGIIENCRKMIFLTPKVNLPQVLKICGDIKNFLCFKKTVGSKTCLESKTLVLINALSSKSSNDDLEMQQFAEKLGSFYEALESAIESELPTLRK